MYNIRDYLNTNTLRNLKFIQHGFLTFSINWKASDIFLFFDKGPLSGDAPLSQVCLPEQRLRVIIGSGARIERRFFFHPNQNFFNSQTPEASKPKRNQAADGEQYIVHTARFCSSIYNNSRSCDLCLLWQEKVSFSCKLFAIFRPTSASNSH